MTTVTISMPESLKGFLEREVAEKGYGNTSEYIRELLRGAQKRAADERLEALLLEGLDSGPGREWTPEYRAELRAGFQAMRRRRPAVSDR